MRNRKVFLTLRILLAAIPIFLLIQNYGTTIRIWLNPVTTTLGQLVTALPDKEITTLIFLPGNDAESEFKIKGDDHLSGLLNRLSSLQVKEKIKSDPKGTDPFDSIWLDVQGSLRVILDVSEDRDELLLLKISKDNTTTRWYSVLNQEEMEQIMSLIMAKRTD
ncbi:hypothetical protein [Paenibacillus sp. FSL M7-0420]|uniref:hypothetical protein n=1 Tax=Paenibacillus sp. FSL M7-0420 TaxID=2921609 RepID=UPI0030F5A932